jgi:IS30 family transposase
MESPSKISLSLREKSPLTEEPASRAGEPGKRSQQSHTRAQRQDFLSAVARLGTVAAAAKELGINRSTCQKWANAAGIRPQHQYTQANKDQFYAVLDRTGTITAAAQELGLNISTAQNWAGKVNPAKRKPRATRTGKPAPAQRHPSAVIEEFLGLLREIGNVSATVRQLGLNHSTCHNWAKAAGLVSVGTRGPSAKQIHYLRLRQEGTGRRDAALTVGASKQSSYVWDRQQAAKDTAAAQGHAVDLPYKQEVRTIFAEPSAPAAAPELTAAAVPELPASVREPVPAAVSLEALEQPISARYLSLQERERIADLRSHGTSMQAIGRALGRSVGTISREIKRNSHPVLGYRPYSAHRAATAARARPKDSKLAEPGELHDYVKTKLLTRWSPEQISKLLIKEFPDDEQMRVSPETIYQALYFQARGGLKREVKEALRSGRTRRKQHRNPEERTSRFRDPMINISERPAEVEDRAVPGHGGGGFSDRSLQPVGDRNAGRTHHPLRDVGAPAGGPYRRIGPRRADQDHVHPAGAPARIPDLGPRRRNGQTQGIQHRHRHGRLLLRPRQPLATRIQREHCLLRQYFPKGTDLNAYGPEDLEHVAQELNARPRKTLDWDTPAERLRDLLIAS